MIIEESTPIPAFKPRCIHCGEVFALARYNLSYRTCLDCGAISASRVTHCIVPLNKSNYVLVTDATILTQLNPKRTT